jgi:hypothetical protein
MALTQRDFDQIQNIVHAEVDASVKLLVSALKEKLDQLAVSVKGLGTAVVQLPASMPQGIDGKELATQLDGLRSLLSAGVVASLRESAPRLFSQVEVGEKPGEDEVCDNLYLVEHDGTVHIAGAGSVQLKAGQVLDRRTHPVDEIVKQRVPVRRMFSSEALRYGMKDRD